MAEIDDRLAKLEAEVQELKGTVRPGETPAFGIAWVTLLIIHIIVISKMPLPDDWRFISRAGFGLGILVAAGALWCLSFGMVEASLKVITEVAAVLIMAVNVAAGLMLFMFFANIRDYAVERLGVPSEKSMWVVIIAAVVVMLVFDLFAFLIVYPMSKVAGTKLFS